MPSRPSNTTAVAIRLPGRAKERALGTWTGPESTACTGVISVGFWAEDAAACAGELERRFPGLIRAIVTAHTIQSADEARAKMPAPKRPARRTAAK